MDAAFSVLAHTTDAANFLLETVESLAAGIRPWLPLPDPQVSATTAPAATGNAAPPSAPPSTQRTEPAARVRPSVHLPEPPADGRLHLVPIDGHKVHLWFRCDEEHRDRALLLREENDSGAITRTIALGPHATHTFTTRPAGPGVHRWQLGFLEAERFVPCCEGLEVQPAAVPTETVIWRDLATGQHLPAPEATAHAGDRAASEDATKHAGDTPISDDE